MKTRISAVMIVLLLVGATFAHAQRRRWWNTELTPGWSSGPLLKSALLKDDPSIYLGAGLDRRLGELFTVGAVAYVLVGSPEARTDTRYERVEHLVYGGARLEYSDVLRGRVRYFFGTTVSAGTMGLYTLDQGVEGTTSGLFLGVEPEAGLLLRASRRLQLTVATGMLFGRINGTDIEISSGPSATFGIRWVVSGF